MAGQLRDRLSPDANNGDGRRVPLSVAALRTLLYSLSSHSLISSICCPRRMYGCAWRCCCPSADHGCQAAPDTLPSFDRDVRGTDSAAYAGLVSRCL